MLLSPKPACGGFDFDRATLISSTYPLKALDLLNSKLLPIRFRHQKMEVEFSHFHSDWMLATVRLQGIKI